MEFLPRICETHPYSLSIPIFLFAALPEIIHISDFFLYPLFSFNPLIFSQSHLLFVSSAFQEPLSLFGV